MASERGAPQFVDATRFDSGRHRQEDMRYLPELVAARIATGRPLPSCMQEEFEAYLPRARPDRAI
jgi:hypothetical protein